MRTVASRPGRGCLLLLLAVGWRNLGIWDLQDISTALLDMDGRLFLTSPGSVWYSDGTPSVSGRP